MRGFSNPVAVGSFFCGLIFFVQTTKESDMAVTRISTLERLQLLDPEAVARLLGIKVGTLYTWRYKGKGPKSITSFGRVKYTVASIEDFLREKKTKRK
jgi:hypothetical protein